MIKTLTLYNFRQYHSSSFTFSEGINYICGPNAAGKTALLEAIALLFTGGRSFRTSHQEELIREGERGYYIEAHFMKDELPHTLSIAYDRTKKKVLHNGAALPNLSSLFGIIRGTLLIPEDELLIKGAPSHRRLYCDLNLAQLKPTYLHHLSRYHQALKQRNVLLKQKQEKHLSLFEREMALSAKYIIATRKKLIEEMNHELQEIHPLLSDKKETLALTYLTQFSAEEEFEENFLRKLEEERKKAFFMGYSTLGPHRDDLSILLSGKEAKQFASEGQRRLATTTLRLAQWHYLKKHSNEKPLLCIDDFGLALDQKRRGALFEYIQDLGQLFLTSHEATLPHPQVQLLLLELPLHHFSKNPPPVQQAHLFD